MSLFFDAVQKGDLSGVINFVSQDPKIIDTRDNTHMTPLMVAIYNEHYEIAEYLILQGADVNAISDYLGSAVVHFAAEKSNLQFMEFLITNGANIHVCNTLNNYSVLSYAILTNQEEMLKMLMGLKVNPSTVSSDSGDTLMHLAAAKNNTSIVQLLLEAGFSPDQKNFDKETVLQYTVSKLNEEVIFLLCKIKNVNAYDYIVGRKLSNVFNFPGVSKLLENDGCNYTRGGSGIEATIIIIELFEQYILTVSGKNKRENLSRILGFLKQFHRELLSYESKIMKFDEANCDSTFYFMTGSDTHSLYGSRIYSALDNHYTLSLYERGLFAQNSSQSSHPSIQREVVIKSKAVADEVIRLFHGANYETNTKAREILFTEIPKKIGKGYSALNILQKPFKGGRCYFENLKSLLLGEMIRYFGLKQGRRCYKEFDLFMHQTTFDLFKAHSTRENRHEIYKQCEALLKIKKEKFEKLSLDTQCQTISINEAKQGLVK